MPNDQFNAADVKFQQLVINLSGHLANFHAGCQSAMGDLAMDYIETNNPQLQMVYKNIKYRRDMLQQIAELLISDKMLPADTRHSIVKAFPELESSMQISSSSGECKVAA